MKNILVFATFVIVYTNLLAQGIPVSHTPEKKNVVLEEYTGIHCPWCPDGHKIANQLETAYPGDVVLINVHAGSYAVPNAGEPDFRTPDGTYIANQSGLTGYPSGSINRHVFPAYSQTSGKHAMSRSNWTAAATQILAQNSYANLGVEATIDVQTNLLTVHVQVYYTSSPSVSTNRIHVALLQDNVEGPQTGAQNLNPGQILPNGNYNHMNALRDMLSGISGETITASVGSTIDEYFTYTIPGDITDIPVVLQDLKIAAFLSETTTEIITGQAVKPTFINFPSAHNSKVVDATVGANPVCGFTASPAVTIQNFGSQPLTSLYIDYSVNGSPVKTKYWTGSLSSISETVVLLDDISYFPSSTNTLEIVTRLPNGTTDGDESDNEKAVAFPSAADASTTVTLTLPLDNYGSEVTWEVVNSTQNQLYSGGPYTDNVTTTITEIFSLTSGDCYEFIVYDDYGDGLIGGAGIKLQDSDGLVIVSGYKSYGAKGTVPFGVDAPQPDSSDVFTGIFSAAARNESISVYPNPANDNIQVNIDLTSVPVTSIYLTDLLGKRVKTITQNSAGSNGLFQISVAELTPGIYFLNAESATSRYTEKILIAH